MPNGKVMMINLIAGLIKKTSCDSIVRALKTLVALQRIKMSKYFPSHLEVLEEILTLKLIFQIMQQKQILKMFHMLILQFLH